MNIKLKNNLLSIYLSVISILMISFIYSCGEGTPGISEINKTQSDKTPHAVTNEKLDAIVTKAAPVIEEISNTGTSFNINITLILI